MDIDTAIKEITDALGVDRELPGQQRSKLLGILTELHDQGYALAERHATGDFGDPEDDDGMSDEQRQRPDPMPVYDI